MKQPVTGAVFELGFRPLYFLAGAYAALGVGVWALQYGGWLPGANPLWHAHEMLFGYAFAVIAGFLLTAVRNWTGKPTPTGTPLAIIAALWCAARILALYSLSVAAIADLLFAMAVAIGIGRPLMASGNRRNGFFIVLVVALGAASVAFVAYPRIALALALDMVLFVIAVMAGRVVPAFTNNAILGAGARRSAMLEKAALAAILVLLAADGFGWSAGAGTIALAAAVLHAWRLVMWAPFSTRGRPILWILHLSYAWLVLHLLLRGLAAFDVVPSVLATHALTVGAIGGITLGMMTRTSRGHTARPLSTGSAELAAYLLVQAAAVMRVLLPLVLPGAYAASIGLSALLWSAAFGVFAITYFPILTGPRLDGKPG